MQFALGDTFWFMRDNKPEKAIVRGILTKEVNNVRVDFYSDSTITDLVNNKASTPFGELKEIFIKEDDCFQSKQDLFDSFVDIT